ncbi:disease resistance protein RPM1 [Gossypium australe]|uniref:Disease resistance protein RPM1 n=1 Tax=Gossypium australe TaxID=47621 RepID=A0A5B6X1R4_9ROSI|nr:disease resistance protein RPM1 [Gossypium australe]
MIYHLNIGEYLTRKVCQVAKRKRIEMAEIAMGAEVKLFGRLKKEVENIRIELDYIACFLRQTDPMVDKEDSNGGFKLWAQHVREVAFQIEDVMDEYKLYHDPVARQQQQGLMASLSRIGHMVQTAKRQLWAASKIRDIKTSANEIKERSERYGEALVGIDSPRQELAHRLADAELKRTIVSVVGMAGVEKTTLVRKAFDDEIMRGQVEVLLRTMMRQMYESRKQSPAVRVDAMDGVELISICRDYLYDKRYIVVSDDVWKEDFWRHIEHALLDNNKGSKILMTTRSMNTAEFCKKSSLVHVHNLEPHPLEKAQELLRRTAFQYDEDKQCPEELNGLTFELVKRCQGLPLAVVAIGGLLATKGKDVGQWKRLLESLSAELDGSPHISYVKQILSFSYYDLPYHLKGCLLFMGMFPEDYPISCKTDSDVDRRGVRKRETRSLVQVSVIDSIGDVRNCQLHDLMREVVVSKSKELSFIQTCPENLSNHDCVARHLSICNKSNNFPMVVGNYQTHSAIFFNIEELPKSFCFLLFTKFKLLKELDFEGAPLTYIPEKLGNLFNLKYLSIRDTKVKKLPRSVGKLHKLQTLDLNRSSVSELPVEINMLFNLQYLVAYYKDKQSIYSINSLRGMKLYSNFGSLESLEKQYEVDLEAYSGGNFFRELARLKQLRKLCITKLKSESGNALCDAIQQMIHLQSLRISSIKEEEPLHLHTMPSPPVFLRCLRLRGILMKLPGWIYELRNLTKLTLEWSRISDDSLQILGVLPNLLFFWIFEGYSGAQLHFHKNHFKKLKDLRLCWLNDLKRLIIDEGSLTLVEHLELGLSPQLEELPATISHLKCLKTLSFNNMPIKSVQKLLPDEGSDHWKVRHIPNIYFLYFTVKGAQHRTYKLGDSRLLEFLS